MLFTWKNKKKKKQKPINRQPCVVLSGRCAHMHEPEMLTRSSQGSLSSSTRSPSPPTPSCVISSLFTRHSSSIHSNLQYSVPFLSKLLSYFFPCYFSLSTYCYAPQLTSHHSAAVPLHPLGPFSSILVKCVCTHMCMCAFCPCAPRSPSWTGCLAIINLCLHLKSHLR